MRIILASKSPRRKELLKYITNDFEVITTDIEEVLKPGLTAEEQAKNLAYIKAKSVFNITKGNRIVIGSDTIVEKKGKIYGKPKTKSHAKKMIKELLKDGGIHEVVTGLCIIIQTDKEYVEYRIYDKVKVYLNNMTDIQIDNWINTGKAMDKAGAYAIQDEFAVFVEKIEGNYTTVVGLPVHKVYNILKKYI